MAKSKPRKKYVPKPVIWDTMNFVKVGMAPVTVASKLVFSLRVKNLAAIEALTKGVGVKTDIVALTHAFITAQSIADLNVGGSKEYSDALDAAQEALLVISRRYEKWDKVQVLPAELADLVYGLQVHDAQLDVCTVSDLEKAIHLAKTAIKCNHPGKRRFDTRETL